MSIKKVSIFIAIVFLFVASGYRAFAYTVTCGEDVTGGCKNDFFDDPIFTETNIYPGWSITKTLNVENKYDEDRVFSIQAVKLSSKVTSDPVAQVIKFSIREDDTKKLVYGPVSLSTFKDGDFITLSTVKSDSSRDYVFEVSMDVTAGNEYQNKQTTFDLRLGFDEVSSKKTDDDDDKDDDDDDDDDTTGQVAGTSVFRELALLPVSGSITNEPKPEPKETPKIDLASQPSVAGAATCVDPWWWFLTFFLQVLVHAALTVWVKKYPLVQIAAALPFMYVFWQYFCPVWDVWISAFIGAAFLGSNLIFKQKTGKRYNSKQNTVLLREL